MERRDVLRHEKREGKIPGWGNVRGNMSGGKCPDHGLSPACAGGWPFIVAENQAAVLYQPQQQQLLQPDRAPHARPTLTICRRLIQRGLRLAAFDRIWKNVA